MSSIEDWTYNVKLICASRQGKNDVTIAGLFWGLGKQDSSELKLFLIFSMQVLR